jgi:hypothetical protein
MRIATQTIEVMPWVMTLMSALLIVVAHNQMTTEGKSLYIYFAILCIASFVWWMHSYCVQFLDGSTHHDDNVMGDGPGCITHARGHNWLTKQGESLFG